MTELYKNYTHDKEASLAYCTVPYTDEDGEREWYSYWLVKTNEGKTYIFIEENCARLFLDCNLYEPLHNGIF